MRPGLAALAAADQPDPQSAALLAELQADRAAAQANRSAASQSDRLSRVQAWRADHQAVARWVGGALPVLESVDDLAVPARRAGEPALAIRRYRPTADASRALVYLQGGGWVAGGLDACDSACRQLALAIGAQVFSVDYRLAPESPFPAAADDTVRAFRYLRGDARSFGFDPERLLLAGEGAGGQLALTAVRWLKRDGAALPAALLLFCPMTDRRRVSGSARQFAQGPLSSGDDLRWCWEAFAGESGLPETHPDLSPLLADDLSGLPRTFVLTAACDPLRDEGEQMAVQLRRAGVPAEFERMSGAIHGFLRFGSRLDSAARGLASVAEVLARWRL